MSNEDRPHAEAETAPAPEPAGSSASTQEGAVSRAERIFIRLSVLNTVLAVAGVFTGAVALYAALTESEAVRRQSAATVWPHVQLSTEDWRDGDEAHFAMIFNNAGVGPARIGSVRMVIDGEARRNWAEVVAALVGEADVTYGSTDFVTHRVIRPGESLTLIQTRDLDLQEAFVAATRDPSNSISYCYCSIFDDCWAVGEGAQTSLPEAVDQCPDYGVGAFGD